MEYASLGTAIAAIVGLVSVCKMAGFPKKYAGLLSVVLGVIASLGMAVQGGSSDFLLSIGTGTILGLTAAGAYSGTKAIIKR